MTWLALLLVLMAAFCHASWNLLAKRSGGGAVFVSLFSALSVVVYLPLVLVYGSFWGVHIGTAGALFIAISALLHMGYFLALQQGYRLGDLSLVYPLARGVGPLLAVLLAVAVLGERPSALALAGGGLVVVGVFVVSGGIRGLRVASRSARAAIAFGLLTACFICGYTLVDQHAMSRLDVAPLVYDWCTNLGRTLLIAPMVAGRRADIVRVWRAHRVAVVGVAVLSPLAYILVLTAMSFTPVSYIAPAREVSILVGTVMGAWILGERVDGVRWLAAAGLYVGVLLLALG